MSNEASELLKEREILINNIKSEMEVPPPDPAQLVSNSNKIFIKHYTSYLENNLLMNILEFQSHIMQNGLIVAPSHEYPNSLFKYELPLKNQTKKILSVQHPKKVTTLFLDEFPHLITEFVTFFEVNPDFEFYFWNVTFPNIFCSFICEEFSIRAKRFLDILRKGKIRNGYTKGVVSFINHSNSFINAFLNNFYLLISTSFENDENGNEIEINILLKSFLKAIPSLNQQQIDVLRDFIIFDKTASKVIIKDIIIYAFKLMKYSPLFIGGTFFQENEGKYLSELNKICEDDKRIKQYFDPIFGVIENSCCSKNKLRLSDVIICELCPYYMTLLDFIIICNIIPVNFHDRKAYTCLFEKPLNEKHDTKYLLSAKVFYYWDFTNAFEPHLLVENLVVEGNANLLRRWEHHQIHCQVNGVNPLNDIFDNKMDLDLQIVVLRNEVRRIERAKRALRKMEERMVNEVYIKNYIIDSKSCVQMTCAHYAEIKCNFSIKSMKDFSNQQEINNQVHIFYVNNLWNLVQLRLKHISNHNNVKVKEIALKEPLEFEKLTKEELKKRQFFIAGGKNPDNRKESIGKMLTNFFYVFTKRKDWKIMPDVDLHFTSYFRFLDLLTKGFLSYFYCNLHIPIENKKFKVEQHPKNEEKKGNNNIDEFNVIKNLIIEKLSWYKDIGIYQFIRSLKIYMKEITIGPFFETIPLLNKFLNSIIDSLKEVVSEEIDVDECVGLMLDYALGDIANKEIFRDTLNQNLCFVSNFISDNKSDNAIFMDLSKEIEKLNKLLKFEK